MLIIENVYKSYDGIKKACNDISLTIEEGDIFGFVGHNGAGKTTLLKSIAGIIDFDEGNITVSGLSIKKEPLRVKKMIAYIPDNPDIYESLTGIQYLSFIADIFEVSEEDRQREIEKYANLFEIRDVLQNPISSYSHGMKQKLVIISALIHQPKLLLLDEPFVGLDPKASFQLKEIFKEMCDQGSAIFFSTHVLEVVEKLCNKVAIIKQGKIVAEGDTQTIIKDQSLESIFMEIQKES
ncbi:MAG: ABC transporter [Tenericutes bacterium GWC2_34_14]|nr:MAG: ABC transporter [Tenericutes bacterium GWA2_35_7]OHE29032.1 MAG: ABC transporter [Tenericutes bacterium GWC2_34_14]OHE33985.1 MAG: ABC transporter [Tenericutes bacterium GWE2_34_108]OHE35318.1 MAG: ABC transporter [Tenericutes bacterium GWF1_35_14]OHE38351.1 MAG: ABC transporter [Tenericutes bacterium GWF2_35_184]OHE42686.1 MAG: ABC transporter [Tenericutes bacterium RIFOXYA2_FULL_36_32]OHE43212.1 MAG: ABC transporter [Tenericutes bacterium RIFOXYA12_FULL_35_10]OHE47108.1 MAG: ABC tr